MSIILLRHAAIGVAGCRPTVSGVKSIILLRHAAIGVAGCRPIVNE